MNPGVKFSELASIEHDALFLSDFEITSLSTDSRTIQPGDTYLAIKGENYDGHDYINDALSGGASSLIVSHSADTSVPHIQVEDTVLSLGHIAKIYRDKIAGKVVGITGSNGKTTVKGMVGSICEQCGDVTITVANNNNMIGVPQTILSASASDQFLIVEMGTSGVGEIGYLASIVEPDISLITNISESHLSGIGTREDVFIEKSALIRATRSAGTVVINLDDSYAEKIARLANTTTTIRYGFGGEADIHGEYEAVDDGSIVKVHSPAGVFTYHLHVPGRHNVSNSFAAVAIALALGIGIDPIVAGLESYSGVDGRLQIMQLGKNITLLDDTYNANPASSVAALEVMSRLNGRKIFVFAGMAELGDREMQLHEDIGLKAAELGVDAMFSLGEITRPAHEVFAGPKYWFDSFEALAKKLLDFIQGEDVILIKGSRRYRMDRLARHLHEEVV